ncbi:hypothetical protein Bca4012_091366 [Brassica carinata]|uniref:Uncharacterized protein n=1 Tax=Brassica oleracea TaxID=3712 RepID=A0A3P6FXU3_BRAOL|nr:unnamed protein product [Brassica oleracea]
MVSETESPPLIGPRISFSDGGDFICTELEKEIVKGSVKVSDFEFLSENASPERMHTADELFSEGKLLPLWQEKHSEKLKNVNLRTNEEEEEEEEEESRKVEAAMKSNDSSKNRVSWFIDEDPSPRPPKCTVLWKELLRLKKQRSSSSVKSSLSPSSSTSSSSSLEDKREGKRGKKGLERTRSSTSVRIRPMIHVPVCTPPSKSSVSLPPLFPSLRLKKNRAEKSKL